MEETMQEVEAQETTEEAAQVEAPAKSYTDDEVNDIVKKRVARERSKWEAEIEKERAKATEAEKLRSMTDLERAQAERESYAKENAELKRKLNLQEQMTVARDTLAGAGIHMSDELLSMFVSDDAEKTKASVDSVASLWKSSVDEAVKKALSSEPPKAKDASKAHKASAGEAFAKSYNEKINN